MWYIMLICYCWHSADHEFSELKKVLKCQQRCTVIGWLKSLLRRIIYLYLSLFTEQLITVLLKYSAVKLAAVLFPYLVYFFRALVEVYQGNTTAVSSVATGGRSCITGKECAASGRSKSEVSHIGVCVCWWCCRVLFFSLSLFQRTNMFFCTFMLHMQAHALPVTSYATTHVWEKFPSAFCSEPHTFA